MKKRIVTIACVAVLLLVFTVSDGFSWGSAVHSYIGNELGEKGRMKNLDEVYGAMAPDVFNFTFAPYYPFLYEQTHYSFFNLKDVAHGMRQTALADGYISHNGVRGADSTAHHSGLTYGQGQGYVIAKAADLKATTIGSTIEYVLKASNPGLPDDAVDAIIMEICHNFIEASVDILMKRVDPTIGPKVAEAALLRTRGFPSMLVEKYAPGLATHTGMSPEEASAVIMQAEANFRRITILYGVALTQSEDMAVQLLAENLASMAADFLAAQGITLPDGLDLTPLAVTGIEEGMDLCANDFMDEIKATSRLVQKNMTLHRRDK